MNGVVSVSGNGVGGGAGVIPPALSLGVSVLEPENAEDARHDAGVHEDVADTMLADLGDVLVRDVLPTEQGRAQVRAQVATAEAALAVGFRVGQLSAVVAQAVVVLERIAVAIERGRA